MDFYTIRLSNKIRIFREEEGAYIVNREDGTFLFLNETAADWLGIIGHKGILYDDAINKALSEYPPEISEEIKTDFYELVSDMIKQGYLLNYNTSGDDNEEEIYPPAPCEAQLLKSLHSVIIEVTEQCNELCVHCYLPDSRKTTGNSLSLEEIKECINQLIELGVEEVGLSGGEALIYPNLINIVRFAAEKNLKIAILSNLIALSPELLKELTDIKNLRIQVSLYAITNEIHDKITGVNGSCERTKRAISQLRQHNIPVSLSMVVMKENYTDVCKVMKFANEYGCSLRFDYLMTPKSDFDQSNLEHRMSLAETETFLRLILDSNIDFGLQLLKRKNEDEFNLNDSICQAGYDGCCIASNGDVYICPSWQAIPLGNIKTQDLFDIWNNNEKLQEIRSIRQHDISSCSTCDSRDFCTLCLARNYYENAGNMKKPTKETCAQAKMSRNLYQEYSARAK